MELLYEVKAVTESYQKPRPDELPGSSNNHAKRLKLAPRRKPLLSVSVRNLVAFSSYVDLNRNGTKKKADHHGAPFVSGLSSPPPGEMEIAGAHVYVADLNTPWETYLLKNSTSQITCLQWNHPGCKLLLGCEDGQVEVYTMVDNLLNKWQVSYAAYFPGEPIIVSSWLGVPRKVTVNPDKLDSMVYSEKYSVSVQTSSRGFGGKPLDGCVVVSGTGLVGAIVTSGCEDLTKPFTATEKLACIRSQIMFADMAYSKDGDLVLITCNENLRQPMLVNRIKVTLGGCKDKAEVKTSASQSLFLPYLPDHAISSVNFVNKTSTDSLLISMINRSTGSSWLCLYELVVQPVALKSRFQTGNNESINTYKWQQTSQVQFGNAIAEICTLPSQLTSSTNAFGGVSSSMQNPLQNQSQQTTATMTPLIAASLSNGSVILARCDNLQQVCSTNQALNQGSSLSPLKRERDEKDFKSKAACKLSSSGANSANSTESGEVFLSMALSWSGSVLVALTATSNLSIYKLHPNIDASTATTLLELSMMGGLDPWDVMMCLRSNLIDNIVDRLSETFARQPPSVQMHYNARILVIKAGLYRLSSSGTARVNDQQTLLTLYLVSGALKALLRPSDLSSHDKGPAESLSCLLSSKGEALSDVDKVLVHVVAKEYTVEASTLQSLQQFLQWCADLALKLLATLPDLRHSRAPGWEICRDSKAVGTLRELIVLMRIWGLLRPSCLPSFRKTSENLDVLPLLFRLLTRLSVAPHDPDEALMDEWTLKGINPRNQQQENSINQTAYLGLYVGGAVAFLILILVGLKFLIDGAKSNKYRKQAAWDEKLKEQKAIDAEPSNLYPPIHEIPRQSSLTTESCITTIEEVQPRAHNHNINIERVTISMTTNGNGLTPGFGNFNLHHQQPPTNNNNSSSDNLPFNSTTASTASSTANLNSGTGGSNPNNPGRKDSFPFDKFNMPLEDREPILTRVENMRPISSYFNTMPQPSFMEEEDSADEYKDDSEILSRNNQGTLPKRDVP